MFGKRESKLQIESAAAGLTRVRAPSSPSSSFLGWSSARPQWLGVPALRPGLGNQPCVISSLCPSFAASYVDNVIELESRFFFLYLFI